MMQNAWRLYRARSFALRKLAATFVKAWDPLMKRYFYFNQVTNTSQWEKPKLFRNADAEVQGDDPMAAIEAKAQQAMRRVHDAAESNVHAEEEALHAEDDKHTKHKKHEEHSQLNEGDMVTEDIELNNAPAAADGTKRMELNNAPAAADGTKRMGEAAPLRFWVFIVPAALTLSGRCLHRPYFVFHYLCRSIRA